MVEFAGWQLPIQYAKSGIVTEHLAVRLNAELFDVSHMREILCEGEKSLKNLNLLMTNDFTSMVVGQARYSLMCNDKGGVVDDLIVYKFSTTCYFIVVNIVNKNKDLEWMQSHVILKSSFKDVSDIYSQIIISGTKIF